MFSDVDHHVAVSLVSLQLLVTKTKWRPVEALVAECHHLGGENKHTSGVCWPKHRCFASFLRKKGVWGEVRGEGNSQKGGLSPEGQTQSSCEIQKKWKSESCSTVHSFSDTPGKKASKEATKEHVTRECHVKNVVFVTAPGETAIPYLLVDNFSLGKREIEWAQVFFCQELDPRPWEPRWVHGGGGRFCWRPAWPPTPLPGPPPAAILSKVGGMAIYFYKR